MKVSSASKTVITLKHFVEPYQPVAINMLIKNEPESKKLVVPIDQQPLLPMGSPDMQIIEYLKSLCGQLYFDESDQKEFNKWWNNLSSDKQTEETLNIFLQYSASKNKCMISFIGGRDLTISVPSFLRNKAEAIRQKNQSISRNLPGSRHIVSFGR